MNEQDLERLFNQNQNVSIDPNAKKRAINAAMAEFAKAQTASPENSENKTQDHQGFFSALRPIKKLAIFDWLYWREEMKNKVTKWVYGSVAGVSVALFAGFIVLRNPLPFNPSEEIEMDDDLAKIMTEYRVDAVPVEKIPPSTSLTVGKPDRTGKGGRVAEKEEVIASAARRNETAQEVVILTDSVAADMSAPVGRSAVMPMLATVPKKQRRQAEGDSAVALEVFSAASPATVSTGIVSSPSLAHVPERKAKASHTQKLSRMKMMISPPVSESLIIQPPKEQRERFEHKEINAVKLVSEEPVSTFSVDVDTASYSFVRQRLSQGYMPNPDAVRVEEFLNYFDYDYPQTNSKKTPFTTHVMVGDSPWKAGNKLLHIGIKGYDITEQPRSNMVFLLDVSGSMSSQNKLPLVKQSISLLLDQLRPDDTVAIVVYAGAAGTVLEPTEVKDKQKILAALNRLSAGGSTAGAQGIQLAYQLAEQNFDKNAVNRILLATDGDFNVGISNPEQLKTLVERKRETGIYLSVLGFGQGNYHDTMMQVLAQNGNGVAAYIDTLSEAQKVLVNEATSSLFTIAKDVKIQIEFNPATVAEYRLIGYETRALAREDFNNDKVDAGDIGSGHTVTAIYEITPVGAKSRLIEPTRYSSNNEADGKSDEYALLKLRYKLPKESESKLITQTIASRNTIDANENKNTWQTREFYFSAAVAGFAQLLKNDKYMGDWKYDDAIEMALDARGRDEYGYRNELVQLIRKAKLASKN